jgi:hypothetical protein
VLPLRFSDTNFGRSGPSPSLSEPERRDVWEICEDGCQVRSTILSSQTAGLALARTDPRSYAGGRHPRPVGSQRASRCAAEGSAVCPCFLAVPQQNASAIYWRHLSLLCPTQPASPEHSLHQATSSLPLSFRGKCRRAQPRRSRGFPIQAEASPIARKVTPFDPRRWRTTASIQGMTRSSAFFRYSGSPHKT